MVNKSCGKFGNRRYNMAASIMHAFPVLKDRTASRYIHAIHCRMQANKFVCINGPSFALEFTEHTMICLRIQAANRLEIAGIKKDQHFRLYPNLCHLSAYGKKELVSVNSSVQLSPYLDLRQS